MSLKAYLVPHPPIMVPAVGGGYLDQIPETIAAMQAISDRIQKLKPRSLIIMSPHSLIQADRFCIKDAGIMEGDLGSFGAPEVKIIASADEEMKRQLVRTCKELDIPFVLARPNVDEDDYSLVDDIKLDSQILDPSDLLNESRWKGLDHGIIAPLSYIYEKADYKLNSISYSWLPVMDHYRFGMAIQKAVLEFEEDVVFIVSGDLSHRLTQDAQAGYNPRGAEFDRLIYSSLQKKDFGSLLNIDPELRRSAGECGMNSIFTMLGFFDGYDVDVDIMSYEGPFGVGYMTAEITSGNIDNDRRY